ncbi:hypothetical protein [Sinorhizobium chiapasense]|uniref:Uncharacterized protein n=1 Tax=Sinorhizobium chiapasense TaxID=501572 RepID=A0ABZ2BGA7_9HYPH
MGQYGQVACHHSRTGQLIKKVSPVWRLTTVLSDTVLSPLLVRDTGLFRRALVWPQANPLKFNHSFFFCWVGQVGTSFETPSLRAGAADLHFVDDTAIDGKRTEVAQGDHHRRVRPS